MGYNLVWECKRHKQYAYSIRGEEGVDFQKIVREHRECFKSGDILVHCDADTDLASESNPTPSMWEHEQRPKVVGFR